jgi:HK97 family phage prohead protease
MGYFDYDADVILPGAFSKSINERGPKSKAPAKIKHAMFHDMTKLPFKSTLIEERMIDGKNVLYFESKATNTTAGDEALQLYKEGVYDNHSIGFNYVRDKIKMIEKDSAEFVSLMSQVINPDEMRKSDYAFMVTEVKLWEYSTVAFGANQLTPFLGSKSMDKLQIQHYLSEKIHNISKMLSGGTVTDETMADLEIYLKQLEMIMLEVTAEPIVKAVIDPPEPVTTFDVEAFKKQLITKLKSN